MALPYPPPPEIDFGFGTAYERVAFYERLARWFEKWKPQSGCEGFDDGFTGLPGLHLLPLARQGGRVTVACPDQTQAERIRTIYQNSGLADRLDVISARQPSELAGRLFDVVILFNPFPYHDDWRGFLEAAAAITRDRLIVSVANRESYGALFRRAQKTIQPTGRIDLFDHPATIPQIMRKELARYGTIEIEDFFDAPWWPDLFVDAGDSVASWLKKSVFGIGPKPQTASPRAAGEWNHGPEAYPYCTGRETDLTALRAKIARHPTFDHLPNSPLKRFFAHHRIFVVHRQANA